MVMDMSKETKYILWAIVLPVTALVLIITGVLPGLSQPLATIVFALLIVPSPILTYLAKRRVFRSGPKRVSVTTTQRIAENTYNRKLRYIAVGMQLVGHYWFTSDGI